MREPRLSDVKIDEAGTRRLRSRLAKAKRIKITINIDEASVDILKTMSGSTGVPYQTLLNQILREGLGQKKVAETRLDHLEKEVEKLNRKLAA